MAARPVARAELSVLRERIAADVVALRTQWRRASRWSPAEWIALARALREVGILVAAAFSGAQAARKSRTP